MQKTLETITVKACEKLPLNWTFFEKDGFCTKENPNCYYAQKTKRKDYRCTKQTYTLSKERRHTIPA